jgi:hypothetical protein
MTRDLATKIAGEIFDRVERDRRLIRSDIEEVISDGLLLNAAKGGQAGEPDPVRRAAEALIRLVMREPDVTRNTHYKLDSALAELYRVLTAEGWKP